MQDEIKALKAKLAERDAIIAEQKEVIERLRIEADPDALHVAYLMGVATYKDQSALIEKLTTELKKMIRIYRVDDQEWDQSEKTEVLFKKMMEE
jgi:hypothetical protein